MNYRGFVIEDNPPYAISKAGRPVFTAWWQVNDNLIQAAAMIDASLAARIEPAPAPADLTAEPLDQEDDRFARWMQTEADNQIKRDEQ